MSLIKAKHFVDAELPPAQRALIPPALRRAYGAVEQLYQQEPLFSVESAVINSRLADLQRPDARDELAFW